MAKRSRRMRKQSPMYIAAILLIVLLGLLPSALNLPQSNPTQTLEYAPVPPNDDSPPAGAGGLASLGLSGGSSLSGGVGENTSHGTGASKTPSTKRCVGKPPRQTEDPLSPPCVAHFSGDNLGATYPGVTRDEVRVLFYVNGGQYAGNSQGVSDMPHDTYWNLADPAKTDDPIFVVLLRAYQRYFNDRYQTYGRFVHFFVRFNQGVANASPDSRAADASNDFTTVRPAAVVLYASAYAENYIEQMNRRGVIAFLGNGGGGGIVAATATADAFSRHAPLLWGYYPSAEQRARNFVSYVCTKVVPYPVSFSGNSADAGKARKLALLREGNAGRPDLVAFSDLVEKGVTSCGGRFEVISTTSDNVDAASEQGAAADVALFQQKGVTTIIRAGGNTDPAHSQVAGKAGYYPEWVLAGNGLSDQNLNSQVLQDQAEWRHARIVSNFHLAVPIESQYCFVAAREADPTLARIDIKNWACGFYPGIRMLFTGIQVAGRRLGPTNLDRGYHAIPAVRGTDPGVPACYYDRGDYTCVKDAVSEWWDPAGQDPGSGASGCWRVMEAGKRYGAGTWPRDDVETQRSPSDPCNFQGVGVT